VTLSIFWLLKAFGVFQVGTIPPNWVKVSFIAPLDIAAVVGIGSTLYGSFRGMTYDFTGGAEVRFSEEPFRFLFCVIFQLVAFVIGCFILTSIMLGYDG
jgi:hypothetical protein